MKFQLAVLLFAVFGIVEFVEAQQADDIAPATDPMRGPESVLLNKPEPTGGPANGSAIARERAGLHIGSPNAIKVGGGEGLRLGPPGMGVQYGGGGGVRYGTERIGVRYGGGEGVRYGTQNIGVQYGGGQILRWGTPDAGVKIGGGEGFRIGTREYGLQFGTGHGVQIGRIRSAGN